MKYIKTIGIVLIFIALTNYVFIFRSVIGMIFSSPKYHIDYFNYSTIHGKFQASEEPLKGPNFHDIKNMSFKVYLKNNITSTDTVLYRTFKKDIWEFWNWGHFFTDERYKLPYLDVNNQKVK